MSLAADIRMFHGERCSVSEIAEYLRVSRSYVRHVLREWGLLPPTPGSYPDTPAKQRFARAQR